MPAAPVKLPRLATGDDMRGEFGAFGGRGTDSGRSASHNGSLYGVWRHSSTVAPPASPRGSVVGRSRPWVAREGDAFGKGAFGERLARKDPTAGASRSGATPCVARGVSRSRICPPPDDGDRRGPAEDRGGDDDAPDAADDGGGRDGGCLRCCRCCRSSSRSRWSCFSENSPCAAAMATLRFSGSVRPPLDKGDCLDAAGEVRVGDSRAASSSRQNTPASWGELGDASAETVGDASAGSRLLLLLRRRRRRRCSRCPEGDGEEVGTQEGRSMALLPLTRLTQRRRSPQCPASGPLSRGSESSSRRYGIAQNCSNAGQLRLPERNDPLETEILYFSI